MKNFYIGSREVGAGQPAYIIAEISANHNHEYSRAVELLHAAKEAGADAVKIQTYTPDTMTIDCDNDYFKVRGGTPWDGYNLYKLYEEAYTPWEWQPKLKEEADRIGISLFSTPFDATSVDFLEEMKVDCYKIASFELIDIPLLKKVASTQKPVIMSTGMGTLAEIEEAVRTLRENGTSDLALLVCTSAYPAPLAEMNLKRIPHLLDTFDAVTGLSDHSLGIVAPVVATSLGASVIEKHFTISRDEGGPDSSFSLTVEEFGEMVKAIRDSEKIMGCVQYREQEKEKSGLIYRRSLFAVEDIAEGEAFTPRNVRCIRPSDGLHPRNFDVVMKSHARAFVKRGTPLSWDIVS